MSKRQAAFLLAKVAFAAGALWFLFHKIDASRVWNSIRHANPVCVGAGVLLFWFCVAIGAWRWQQFLAVFEIKARFRSLMCIVQIGQFFAMFMPGATGDDLTRMVYISRLAPGHTGEACAVVLFDRIIGMSSVLALALFCIPARWHLLSGTQQTYWLANGMLIAGGAVSALGLAFFLSGRRHSERFFGACLRLLPRGKLRDELDRMTGLLCANKAAIARVIIAATVTQLLSCAVYCLAGLAVGIHVSLVIWFSFVPVVIAASAFPVTVAGLGVREYLLVLFLGVLAHVAGETALAASILVLAMMIVVCLVGGLVYILYRPKHPAPDAS